VNKIKEALRRIRNACRALMNKPPVENLTGGPAGPDGPV